MRLPKLTPCGFSLGLRARGPSFFPGCLEPKALVVSRLGCGVSRAAVMAQAAARGVASVAPTAWRNRAAMPGAKPLLRRRHLEAQHAAFRAIAGPPPATQNGKTVTLTTPFIRRWHFLRAIAFRATGIAMTSAPIARTNRSAVNLAEFVRARTGALSNSPLLGAHDA